MARPPTSRDLARLAGVSQATVSRVLTNNPKVNPETRARVLQVLKDANYIPNALARAMKTGRTDTIGVFMTRVTSPFHAALLDEIGRVLSSVGQHMILWNIEHDPEDTIAGVLRQRLVDGFLLTSATYDSKLHTMALSSGTPTVLLHRGIDGLDCDQVVGDNWQGAYDAGRYLVEAGHTDIGLVTLTHTGNTSRDRDLGFRAALADAGVKIKPGNVVPVGVPHADGHAAAQKLLSRKNPADRDLHRHRPARLRHPRRRTGTRRPGPRRRVGDRLRQHRTRRLGVLRPHLGRATGPRHRRNRREPPPPTHRRPRPSHRNRHPPLPADHPRIDRQYPLV